VRWIDHDGISLATQSLGRAGDPAMVLVMGATASMLGWPDEFCAGLAERGLRVIRFDHRDTGRSTTAPPGEVAYTVEDLAGDVIAILDAYGLDRAHLAGMSLGGYIAQMAAVEHPQRVASLTLIASEPLGWDGEPLPHISQAFLSHFEKLGTLDWSDRDALTDFLVRSEELCAGSGGPFDQARAREQVGRVVSRTDSPASMFNHATLTTCEDWTGRFREITCPVLIVHGEEDPILPVENGRAIAEGIAGASLVVLPRIGHELPLAKISEIAERIAVHARRSSL
jgi:pimeloyl-ACP methyl ester carboxylesterase